MREKNILALINYFRSIGWHDEFICGLLGNIECESAHTFNPKQVQLSYLKNGLTNDVYVSKVDNGTWKTADGKTFVNDRYGFGLCQWTSEGRKTALLIHAKSLNKSVGDLDVQKTFIPAEIATTGYANVRKAIKDKWTLEECTRIICKEYERPASMSGDAQTKEKAFQTRIDYARAIWNEFFVSTSVKQEIPKKKIRIMLDAGHDRQRNQSPVYKSYNEATFAWKLQNELKAELEKRGFEVGVTRLTQDTEMDVVERGKASKGYDVFLSLHSNACGTESVDRPVVIYPVTVNGTDIEKNKELATLLADKIHTTIGTSQVGKVYTKVENYDRNKNGKLGDDEYYGVLHGAQMVGTPYRMIVEHSFHTNLNATKWLYKDANIHTLAEAEANILSVFFALDDIKVDDSVVNSTVTYTVVKGDTLSKIASKFSTTVDEIMALNKFITNKNVISVGWVLTIPSKVIEVIEDSKIEYVVQKGDTLSKIAKEHGTTVLKLQAKNGVINPNKIYVGEVLTIK